MTPSAWLTCGKIVARARLPGPKRRQIPPPCPPTFLGATREVVILAGAQTLDCRFYEGSLWSCVQTGVPVRIEAVDAERVRYRYVVAGTRSYVRTHDEFLQLFRYVPPLDEILRR